MINVKRNRIQALMIAKIITFISIIIFSTCQPIKESSLSIKGNSFYLNDEPFDMLGIRVASASQTDSLTEMLVAELDDYKKHGINTISIYVQGSSGGYSDPFSETGTNLDEGHAARIERIIKECDKKDMIVIVGIFYQRIFSYEGDSLRKLSGKESIYTATETITKMLEPFKNVIINIANEQNSSRYKQYKSFNFNDPNNIIDLCRHVKHIDSNRIVGGGGYNDSLNIIIGKSKYVDVLLFDTFSKDIENNQSSGWHYDYFLKEGVVGKPMVNIEIFGSWTNKAVPQGVYTGEQKQIHLEEIDEAKKRDGLYIHFHSTLWCQGTELGYPIRYDLGGEGTKEDPGIRWFFEYANNI